MKKRLALTCFVHALLVLSVTCGYAFDSRRGMTANATFYVASIGNDAHGCSNDTTDACLTLQRAYDNLANNYDLRGFTATIQLGEGIYSSPPGTSCLATSQALLGQNGPGGLVIRGNASPSKVVLSSTNADCIRVGDASHGRAEFTIGGVKITTTLSGNSINLAGGGVGVVVGMPGFPVEFGPAAQDHMVTNHSAWLIAGTDNFVSGDALIHAAALSNSVLALHNTSETFLNAPTFSFYAYSDTNSSLFVEGMKFVNGRNVRAVRFHVANNAIVYALGGPAYLPGDEPGEQMVGGTYVTGRGSAYADLPANKTGDAGGSGMNRDYVESGISMQAAVPLSSGIVTNVTTLLLAPGDWDIDAVCQFTGAPDTTVDYLGCGVSTSSSAADQVNGRFMALPFQSSAIFRTLPAGIAGLPVPPFRFRVSALTTIYCTAQAGFKVGPARTFGICRARIAR